MGWDEGFLQEASNQCTDLSGKIEDCPLFTIQPLDNSTACNIAESNMPAQLAKDVAAGGATTLPGNPPIVSTGDASDAAASVSVSASSSAPSSPVSVSVSIAPAASTPTSSEQQPPSSSAATASGGQYAPDAVFAAKSPSSSDAPAEVSTAATPSSSPPAVTPAPSPAFQSSASTQSYFSTEYQTKGQEVVEVLWVEDVVTVTAPSARKRHLHKHRRGVL